MQKLLVFVPLFLLGFWAEAQTARICLTVEPACTQQNLNSFPSLRPGGLDRYAFYTEPLRALYSQRSFKAIWHDSNNQVNTEKVQILISFVREVSRNKGLNLNDKATYLSQFLGDRRTNITTEYFATSLLVETLDKVSQQRGKFFSNFRDLALIVNTNGQRLSDDLYDYFVDFRETAKPAPVQPRVVVTVPPVAPQPPPRVVTPPVQPERPVQPAPPVQVVVPQQPEVPQSPLMQNPSETPWVPQVQVDLSNERIVVSELPVGLGTSKYSTDPQENQITAFASSLAGDLFLSRFGMLTDFALETRRVLRMAHIHGLNPDDYWDAELDQLTKNINLFKQDEVHYLISRGLLRYTIHLSVGRIDPSTIDSFQFKKKDFIDFQSLVMIMNNRPRNLDIALSQYVPTVPQYKELQVVLAHLRNMLTAYGPANPQLSRDLNQYKMGAQNTNVARLRNKLFVLGYAARIGSNVYDQELDDLIKYFSQQNGLPGKLSDQHIMKLNVSLTDRIKQVEVNIEKLRYLPVGVHEKMIFVNLAFSELKYFKANRVQMQFRTVNGRSNNVNDDKKTPSMTQVMRYVLLNPTWTVPPRMALNDKVPTILKDANYLVKNNFRIADGFSDRSIFDPIFGREITKRLPNYLEVDQVDWTAWNSAGRIRYWLVQQPGYVSTLGVLKFPLWDYENQNKINADDIYMHDTNERQLFANSRRLDSSGCVRLQYPVEFAAEIIEGRGGYDIERIRSFLPTTSEDMIDEEYTNLRVDLPRPLTVHMLYLTSEMGPGKEARFIEDQLAYKLDAKILAALQETR